MDNKIIPLGIESSNTTDPILGTDTFVPLRLMPGGGIWAGITGLDGGGLPTPITSSIATFDAGAPGSATGLDVAARLYALNEAGFFDRLRSLADNGDAQAALTLGLLATISRQQAWNGASWDRVRTPNVFKTVSIAAAGSTAVWTPAANKKFRLMGYSILLSSNITAAAAANSLNSFLDGAAAIGITFNPFIPAVFLATYALQSVSFVSLGNGYLSTAANNVLNFNLTNALTAGNYTINVIGIEE